MAVIILNVTILKQTSWQGVVVRAGDNIPVDPSTAKRWAAKGIALIDEIAESVADEFTAFSEEVTPPADYLAMKPKELFELCVARGIETVARQTVEVYVGLLQAADAALVAATQGEENRKEEE